MPFSRVHQSPQHLVLLSWGLAKATTKDVLVNIWEEGKREKLALRSKHSVHYMETFMCGLKPYSLHFKNSERWKDLPAIMGWERKGPALEKGEPGAPAELRARAYLDGDALKKTNN